MRTIQTGKAEGRVRNRPLKDYTGETFGRLTARRLIARDAKWNDHRWLFSCECGGEKIAGIKQVKAGKVSSCGCAFRQMMQDRNRTHGLSAVCSKEYAVWKGMRDRCQRPSNKSFKDYGARGISVCARWKDFSTFYSDMGQRPAGASIDRIDHDANYSPENCRWASARAQANNKRSNHLIEMGGESKTLAEWCAEIGIEPSKVRYRLKAGMSPTDAFRSQDLRRHGNNN